MPSTHVVSKMAKLDSSLPAIWQVAPDCERNLLLPELLHGYLRGEQQEDDQCGKASQFKARTSNGSVSLSRATITGAFMLQRRHTVGQSEDRGLPPPRVSTDLI